MPLRRPLRRHSRYPPADLVAGLDLAPRERLLAWSGTSAGGAVVATDQALYLRDREAWLRIGWERVDRATWDGDEEILTVVEARPDGRPWRHRVVMDDPAALVGVVRERVEAAVVLSRRVPITGGRGITVVGRRPPGQDRLTWTVAVDRGLDLADPETKARVDAAVAQVRAEVGG